MVPYTLTIGNGCTGCGVCWILDSRHFSVNGMRHARIAGGAEDAVLSGTFNDDHVAAALEVAKGCPLSIITVQQES